MQLGHLLVGALLGTHSLGKQEALVGQQLRYLAAQLVAALHL